MRRMQTKIEQFIDYLANQRGRSANTCDNYRHDLEKAAQFFSENGIDDWTKVDQYAAINFIAQLKSEQKAKTTINRQISSLKQFFRYLLRTQQLSTNPMDFVDREKISTVSSPVVLSTDEIEQLFSVPDIDTTNGIRDRALLELMYGTGMQVSELINLKRDQVYLDLCILKLQSETDNQRIVPLGQYAVEWLEKYLTATKDVDSPFVFLNRQGAPLSRQGIWKNFKSWVAKAGLDSSITPQALRQTYIADMINHGADWQAIQALLGQKSQQVAANPYIHYQTKDLIKIFNQFHPRA